MKRVGFLFSNIVEMENLRLAYWKACRKKSGKQEVIEFQKNLESNLLAIQKQLKELKYKFGSYHYFKIYDPKERVICAASFPERIIHHAIMNICDPYFEKFQIYHSYATRKNKGTFAAIDIAKKYTEQNRFFLKLDIRKYFDSIDHMLLLKLLSKKFKDPFLLKLFKQIIASYSVDTEKGLPIGNLTSQYFANYYLAFLDHFIKEELGIRYYVRYMDDMVIFANDKDSLKDVLKKITEYLNDKLCLNLKQKLINYTSKGLPFLGFTLFPNNIKLNSRSKKRFIRKINFYANQVTQNNWDQSDYQSHILPLLDFVKKANSYNFRKLLLEKGINRGLETC